MAMIRKLLILIPIIFLAVFLYMTFYNAAYDHPGKAVYESRCASCHGDQGEGIKSLVPPIAHSDMGANQYRDIPCWIIKGMNGPITVNGKSYDQPMYPLELSDVEITNLINYLSQEMLPPTRTLTTDSINLWLKRCE